MSKPQDIICPITWMGYGWEPHRLLFTTADGLWWSVPLSGAHYVLNFDTTTPERRDWLRKYIGALERGENVPAFDLDLGMCAMGRRSLDPAVVGVGRRYG